MTFCLVSDDNPDESVAVQVTIVSPTGNFSGASFVMLKIDTASAAVASPRLTVLLSADVASAVMSAGAAMLGAVVSTMVIFCVAVAELPASSVAVHVTVVSPTGNFSGASFVIDSTPTTSVAVASPIETLV